MITDDGSFVPMTARLAGEYCEAYDTAYWTLMAFNACTTPAWAIAGLVRELRKAERELDIAVDELAHNEFIYTDEAREIARYAGPGHGSEEGIRMRIARAQEERRTCEAA